MGVNFGKLQLTEERALESYFEESINLKLINSLIIAKEKENFRGSELSSYFKGYLLPLYKDFGGELFARCHGILDRLEIDSSMIEFYISNTPEFNCSSINIPDKAKPDIIVINRGLLEKLSLDEMGFVIGHEIGHILFGHSYVTKAIQYVYPEYEKLPPFLMKLYEVWRKLAEISCDRIGLLACNDYEVSIRALFKLSSGLEDNYFNLTTENMLSITEKAFEEMKENPSYLNISHPANPLRIKAIKAFYNSESWKRISEGKDVDKDESLEKEMENIKSHIRRAPLNELETLELQFISSAGLILMLADKEEIEEKEHTYLINILSEYIHWPQEYFSTLTEGDVVKKMQEAVKTIKEKAPWKTRQLAGKLLPIIIRDNKLYDSEVNTYIKICVEELGINISEVVDSILAGIRQMYSPLS